MNPNNERKSLSVKATNAWDVLIVFIRSKLAIIIAILIAIALGMKLDFLTKLIDLVSGL